MKNDINQPESSHARSERLERCLKKPYWVFDKDFKKQYYARFNVKLTMTEAAKKMYLGPLVALPVAIFDGVAIYGKDRLVDWAEDRRSEYIVGRYLIATVGFAHNARNNDGKIDNIDIISIIEKVGFDLLAMSALRYSKNAEYIEATILETLFGSKAYLERRDRYITGKVKNRIIAYMFNVSMIFDFENDEKLKFKSLWDNYTSFESAAGLNGIEAPSQLKHIIKRIRCLTDYESGRFGETLDKRHQFKNSIRDGYALLGHFFGGDHEKLIQSILEDDNV